MSSPAEMFKKFRKLINDRESFISLNQNRMINPGLKKLDLWPGFDSDELMNGRTVSKP